MTTAPANPELDEWVASVREAALAAGPDLGTHLGVVMGAVSACWANLAGAGEFQSQRASALLDLAVEMATGTAWRPEAAEVRYHIGCNDAGMRMSCELGPTRFHTPPAPFPMGWWAEPRTDTGPLMYPVSKEVYDAWVADDELGDDGASTDPIGGDGDEADDVRG